MKLHYVVYPKALAPLGKPRPEQALEYVEGGWRCGIVPMMDDIMKEFVSRNVARGTPAAE